MEIEKLSIVKIGGKNAKTKRVSKTMYYWSWIKVWTKIFIVWTAIRAVKEESQRVKKTVEKLEEIIVIIFSSWVNIFRGWSKYRIVFEEAGWDSSIGF